MQSHLIAFCKESSLHGLKYIVERTNVVERLIWGLAILAATTYSALTVWASIAEYETNPTVTSFDATEINQIPFPAVTVDGGSVWNHMGFTRVFMDPLEEPEPPFTLNERLEPLKIRIFQQVYPQILFQVERILGHTVTMKDIREQAEANLAFETSLITAALRKVESNLSMFLKRDLVLPFFNGRPYTQLLTYMAAMVMENPVQATNFLNTSFEHGMATSSIKLGRWSITHAINEIPSLTVLLNLAKEFAVKANIEPAKSSLQACQQVQNVCEAALNLVGSKLIAFLIFEEGKFEPTQFGLFLQRYFETVSKFPFLWFQIFSKEDLKRGYRDGEQGEFVENKYQNITYKIIPNSPEEVIVADILTEAATRLFRDMPFNISLYEISQIVDLPYHNYRALPYHAKNIYQQMGCYNFHYMFYFNQSKCGPDQPQEIEGCCRVWDAIAFRHEEVLKLMKFNQQVPHPNADISYIREELKKGIFGPFKGQLKMEMGVPNPRIFGCQWLGKPQFANIFDCNLFRRHFTNAGIGYTFNQVDFEDMFLNTTFLSMFQRIMEAKGRGQNDKSNLNFVSGGGPRRTLKIYLELSRYIDQYIKFADPLLTHMGGLPQSKYRSVAKLFKIAIHDPGSVPDLRNDYIEIHPGFEYKILIAPQKIEGEDTLRGMDLERRNCRFEDEVYESRLFNRYSQSGCLLECQLKNALSRCDCLPWNYPHFEVNGQLSKLCDYRGHFCVEEILEQPISWRECGCYPLCDTLSFPFSISSSAIQKPCSMGKFEFHVEIFNLFSDKLETKSLFYLLRLRKICLCVKDHRSELCNSNISS